MSTAVNSKLRSQQVQSGAIFATDTASVPESFGLETDSAAWTAAFAGVALCDRSHCGLLSIGGADRLQFLHNQTTNNIKALAPGQGTIAAIVNSTARLLDLATIYVLPETAWAVVSPGQAAGILAWFDRYVFPADRVELADLTAEVAHFSAIGPESEELLTNLGATLAPDAKPHEHQEVEIAGVPARIAVGTELGLPGCELLVPCDRAAELWQALSVGAVPLGTRVWEQIRLLQGRPLPGRELTEAYNPLEAGLWSAVSLDKGCYIGQETIARLHARRGVKQRLWRIGFSGASGVSDACPVGLFDGENNKIGTLTSVGATPAGELGLAYIRTQAGGPGLTVWLPSGVKGSVDGAPCLSHTYPQAGEINPQV